MFALLFMSGRGLQENPSNPQYDTVLVGREGEVFTGVQPHSHRQGSLMSPRWLPGAIAIEIRFCQFVILRLAHTVTPMTQRPILGENGGKQTVSSLSW